MVPSLADTKRREADATAPARNADTAACAGNKCDGRVPSWAIMKRREADAAATATYTPAVTCAEDQGEEEGASLAGAGYPEARSKTTVPPPCAPTRISTYSSHQTQPSLEQTCSGPSTVATQSTSAGSGQTPQPPPLEHTSAPLTSALEGEGESATDQTRRDDGSTWANSSLSWEISQSHCPAAHIFVSWAGSA